MKTITKVTNRIQHSIEMLKHRRSGPDLRFFICMILLLGSNYQLESAIPAGGSSGTKKLNKPAEGSCFIENRGQVRDQDAAPRPDVLFSGHNHGMIFHLKNSGVSYQLYNMRSDIKQIYRIDVDWLDINSEVQVITGNPRDGYDNYYYGEMPVLNVQSYSDVIYKNIYNKIDLHYYIKDGQLKYDYLVAPHADFGQIRFAVQGATDIVHQNDGSVLLKTPLGDIEEGAPIVYQQGKRLDAKWLVNDNVLSFEVLNYDHDLPLLIDPVTRSWGTFYGGPGQFGISVGNSCITDAFGNVYLVGSTDATSGIATSGGYQTSLSGSSLNSFIVKFNSSGVRQWGTYYGAGSNGNSCAVNANGDVYLAGQTTATANISTTGAHQTSMGGVADGFLVKFNSSGVRQWATYIGGPALDGIQSCVTDAAGNIIIGGYARSSSGISTSGSHQPNYGTGTTYDGFLSKFTNAGVLMWSTYYGGALDDQVNSCFTDGGNNIYICGVTESSVNISTSGCHQPALGGNKDAFLAKFDNAGIRQWATYYGGGALDNGYSCYTYTNGNIVMVGEAASTTSISTPGSYQDTYGGGTKDAFLVMFNNTGVRQWATYIGGTGTDGAEGCFVDFSGNILITGETSSGSGIATAGNHQNTFGGGTGDAFLAKFGNTGSKLWGTYYGGTGTDSGSECAVDMNGKIYLAGSTGSSGTVIATSTSHQPNLAAINDAFLAQFTDCLAPPNPVNTTAAVNLTLCSNNSATLSASASGLISWYSSATSTAALTTGTTLVTPVLSPGTHTFFAETTSTCSASGRTAISVTVNPLLTLNSGAVCLGESFTLVPGGASTYTFMNGSAVVSPTSTSTYTVLGTDLAGCTGAVSGTVTVNTLPVISVNSGSVCVGSSFTIVPTGAISYTYSAGTSVVSPTATSSYTITGTSVAGCVNSVGVSNTVVVMALPSLSVASNRTLSCKGEPVKLTAAGALTYSWNYGGTGTLVTVNPTVSTTYTVTGTGANTCSQKASVSHSVKVCTSIDDLEAIDLQLVIAPNPNNGTFKVMCPAELEVGILEIHNSIGQLVYKGRLNQNSGAVDISSQQAGIYFLTLKQGEEVKWCTKVVKE
jgi:hypothetical protein